MTPVLKVAHWDELYENSRTRDMKRMQWVPVPCKFDGDGYTELLTGHKNGPAHYAAWMAFLLAAGRSEERGTLVRSGARPHDTASISAITKIPKSLLDEALPRLIEIGWIVSDTLYPDRQTADDSPAQPQVACGEPAVTPQLERSLPAGTRTRARASVPFLSIPFFFEGKGVRGKGNELPEILDTDEFRELLDGWIAFKHERGEDYRPIGFKQMISHAANMAKKHGLPAIIDAMTRAMARNWKGWDQDSTFKTETTNGASTGRKPRPSVNLNEIDLGE